MTLPPQVTREENSKKGTQIAIRGPQKALNGPHFFYRGQRVGRLQNQVVVLKQTLIRSTSRFQKTPSTLPSVKESNLRPKTATIYADNSTGEFNRPASCPIFADASLPLSVTDEKLGPPTAFVGRKELHPPKSTVPSSDESVSPHSPLSCRTLELPAVPGSPKKRDVSQPVIECTSPKSPNINSSSLHLPTLVNPSCPSLRPYPTQSRTVSPLNTSHPSPSYLSTPSCTAKDSLTPYIQCPLALACKRGHIQEVLHILSTPIISRPLLPVAAVNVSLNSNENDVDILSQKLDDIESKTKFIHPLINEPDRNGSTPLFHPCWHGNTSVVKALLRAGANVNHQNLRHHLPIYFAIARDHVEIVRLLLMYGSSVKASEIERLEKSMKRPVHPDIRTMLNERFHVTRKNRTFADAVKAGDAATVEKLLNEHQGNAADLINTSELGLTMLSYAAMHGHSKIVSLLVENGADVNQRNADSTTALQVGRKHGQHLIAKQLKTSSPSRPSTANSGDELGSKNNERSGNLPSDSDGVVMKSEQESSNTNSGDEEDAQYELLENVEKIKKLHDHISNLIVLGDVAGATKVLLSVTVKDSNAVMNHTDVHQRNLLFTLLTADSSSSAPLSQLEAFIKFCPRRTIAVADAYNKCVIQLAMEKNDMKITEMIINQARLPSKAGLTAANIIESLGEESSKLTLPNALILLRKICADPSTPLLSSAQLLELLRNNRLSHETALEIIKALHSFLSDSDKVDLAEMIALLNGYARDQGEKARFSDQYRKVTKQTKQERRQVNAAERAKYASDTVQEKYLLAKLLSDKQVAGLLCILEDVNIEIDDDEFDRREIINSERGKSGWKDECDDIDEKESALLTAWVMYGIRVDVAERERQKKLLEERRYLRKQRMELLQHKRVVPAEGDALAEGDDDAEVSDSDLKFPDGKLSGKRFHAFTLAELIKFNPRIQMDDEAPLTESSWLFWWQEMLWDEGSDGIDLLLSEEEHRCRGEGRPLSTLYTGWTLERAVKTRRERADLVGRLHYIRERAKSDGHSRLVIEGVGVNHPEYQTTLEKLFGIE